MRCWIVGVRISEGCTVRAFARSTGCPMRAIFRIDIRELYARQSKPQKNTDEHGHRKETILMSVHEPAFRFCPACGGPLEARQLKAGDPSRLVCARCRFILYLDPKVAVGTVITAADERIVLVRRAIE